jgi:hypothetical protein
MPHRAILCIAEMGDGISSRFSENLYVTSEFISNFDGVRRRLRI